MATIKDIAQLTCVSTATVSNVLNGKAGAAGPAKTREILEVANSLHYTPNVLAKNLKQQKTNSIGIITEDLTVFNAPEIVDGADAYLEENDYEIILGNMRLFKRYNNDFTDTPDHRRLVDSMVSNMIARQIEGIIYVGYHCRRISYLPSRVSVPFVYAYCYPKEEVYPSVMFDDESAAYNVASLLIQKGHRNIGAVCGPVTSLHTQARLKGFQKALFDNNILYNAQTTVYGDWERQSGYANADALLALGVTAIFSFNDLMASGVYERCVEKGLHIGKNISLFGFDNREISQGYTPHIATVEPPLNEIGRKSAEIILDMISRRKSTPGGTVFLPCKIYDRESVGNV